MVKLIALVATTATLAGCSLYVGDAVRADLDGDGTPEIVTLKKRGSELFVTFNGGSLSQKIQPLSFGIDSSRQDAVCGLPVALEVTPAECAPAGLGSEALEGCKASQASQEVALSDGMCDSIHMYWNHEKQAVWWWRL